MNYAYLRQMPHYVSLAQQQREILSFALLYKLDIDKEVVEYSSRNIVLEERKEFETFMQNMQKGDILLVSSFSVLSDKVEEIVKVINCILRHNATLYVANPGRVVNAETSIVDVFPLLNDLREAQTQKRSQIGRPKGSRSSSKFDIYHQEILEKLKAGMNVSAIARSLEVSRSSLKDYIESRGLRELVKGTWIQMPATSVLEKESILLICPFEEKAEEKENQTKSMKERVS